MTTEPSRQEQIGHEPRTVAPTPRTRVVSEGDAWFTFAGVMFVIVGAANLLWGVAALDARPYLPETGLLVGTLDTWGWISLVWGALLVLDGILLFSRNRIAAGLGIAMALIAAIFWLFTLPVFPVWSLLMIGVASLIIYGLSTRLEYTDFD